MTDYSTPAVELADGHSIPLLGFGTWLIKEEEAEEAVRYALEVGYRHVDTATAYRNEAGVGRGLKASGLAREDVFVTTKLPPRLFGEDHRAILEESLTKLGTDYVDLWLVHAPGGGEDEEPDPVPHVWESFVAAQRDGLVRSIGVSNYDLETIDALEKATGVRPVINQIEWNPFLYDEQVATGHDERGIVLQGYSPLRSANLEDATLEQIGRVHEATAADVILAWHVLRGYVVLPRSTRPERIESNAKGAMLQLSPDELERVDALAGTWTPPED